MTESIINKELRLRSTTNSISEVEALIDEISDSFSINEENYGNMLIAITEAVNNAITHGNKLDPDKKVRINLENSDGDFSFTILDEGDGFDFTNIPDPTLPENIENIRGRGIFLMNHLADEVIHNEKGTSVTLTFCKPTK